MFELVVVVETVRVEVETEWGRERGRCSLCIREHPLVEMREQVQTHVVDHLREPGRALVAGRRQVDFNDPRPQPLVQHQVEPVDLERIRSLFHGLGHPLERTPHRRVDPRPELLVPREVCSRRLQVFLELLVRHRQLIRRQPALLDREVRQVTQWVRQAP